jgi:predicted enzyme related to lactoylglutathione lyase
VLAVATRPQSNTNPSADVVWHVLHTNAAARAMIHYTDLFGWEPLGPLDLGPHGVLQQFAWHAGGENVGAIGDIATRPGVHPHWLFFFEVDALDPTMATMRSAGGIAVEDTTLPSGRRVCICDDPQGAAFALHERGHARSTKETTGAFVTG